MAYVLPIDDEEEKKKAESEALKKEESGGPSAGEPIGAGGEAPAQKTPTTTGYTDVRSYLEANRPQAAQLGQTYAQRIGGEETELRGKIGESETEFGKQVESGRVGYEEPFVKQTIEKAGQGWEPGQLEKFTKMREASYGGPAGLTDVSGYGDLTGKVSGASKFGQGLETGESLNEMFYRYGARPTAGNVALDKMLLMGTPEAREALMQPGKTLGGLSEYLTGRETKAKEMAAQAKEETAKTREATQAALQQGITGFETGLGEKVAQQRTSAAAQEAALRDLLLNYQGKSLRDKALQGQLPLETDIPTSSYYNLADVMDMIQKSYGAGAVPGLAGYAKTIGTPETMITTPTVASLEEYAREAALGELAGYDLPILWEADKGMAGTAPKELAKFDIQRAYTEQLAELKKRDREFITKAKPNVDYAIPTAIMQKQNPEMYKKSLEAYERFARNYENLNDMQKQFVDIMQGKQVPGSPWIVPTPLPKPPDIPGEVGKWTDPWKQGEPRTKWIDDPTGQLPMSERYKWWDGTQWVNAPKEYKVENGKKYQFDYNTGKYKEVPMDSGIYRIM